MTTETVYKLVHYCIKHSIKLKYTYIKININNYARNFKVGYNMWIITDIDSIKYIYKDGYVYYIKTRPKKLLKLYNQLEKKCMLIDY